MRIAVLGNAGSWYCKDLERASRARGHEIARIGYSHLAAVTNRLSSSVFCDDDDLSNCDALIVRTMPPGSLEQVVFRMDALAQLEESGVVVLNPAKTIECAVDKYLTTSRLQHAGLPVPDTVVCENSEQALQAFESLGGDVVVKPIFGSEGRGIVRVSDPDLALRTFRTLERIQAVLYIQRFIDHEGFDIRALVFDGRIIGSMRRRSNDDFRTNVSRSGTAETYALTESEESLALQAAGAIGVRFAGIDLLYGRDGQCYVLEVNAVPGWRAFARVTGQDVAAHVIENLIPTDR